MSVFISLLALFLFFFCFPPLSSCESLIPPARLVAPLIYGGNGNHLVATVTIGTPPQSLTLLLDSGSADLILYNQSYCASSGIGPCFNPRLSSSATLSQFRSVFLSFGYAISVDREVVTDSSSSTTDVSDVFFWGMKLVGSNSSQTVGSEVSSTAVSRMILSSNPQRSFDARYSPLGQYQNIDGILGIAPVIRSIYYNRLGLLSAFTAISAPYSDSIGYPTFSIDANAGQFFLGGISEQYRSDIVFSPSSRSSYADYHVFFLTSLSLKGGEIEFLSDFSSSSYPAILDTGSVGLQLPAELFDLLISWLPIICDSPVGVSDRESPVCWMPPESPTPKRLPTIGFKLLGSSKVFYIDLTDLILPASAAPAYRVSITRTGSTKSLNFISFGVRCLKSLYVVVESSRNRVGFAQSQYQNGVYSPQTVLKDRSVGLLTPVECSGMQIHHWPLNVCLEPPCSEYYLFSYNAALHKCELSGDFHIMVGVLIGVFVVVEVFLHELSNWLARKVQREIPPS